MKQRNKTFANSFPSSSFFPSSLSLPALKGRCQATVGPDPCYISLIDLAHFHRCKISDCGFKAMGPLGPMFSGFCLSGSLRWSRHWNYCYGFPLVTNVYHWRLGHRHSCQNKRQVAVALWMNYNALGMRVVWVEEKAGWTGLSTRLNVFLFHRFSLS